MFGFSLALRGPRNFSRKLEIFSRGCVPVNALSQMSRTPEISRQADHPCLITTRIIPVHFVFVNSFFRAFPAGEETGVWAIVILTTHSVKKSGIRFVVHHFCPSLGEQSSFRQKATAQFAVFAIGAAVILVYNWKEANRAACNCRQRKASRPTAGG